MKANVRSPLQRALAMTLVVTTACSPGVGSLEQSSSGRTREPERGTTGGTGGTAGGDVIDGAILRSQEVGTLPGSGEALPSGAFRYTIPIAVPPGVNGVQPALALSFDGLGNGSLGAGASMSGLSSISRCRETIGLDGHNRQIAWTTRDALCLDGERLVTTGVRGQSGTEYRPRSSPLLRVIANGSSDHAISSFTVYRPDGSRAEYGGGGDPTVGTVGNATVLARPGANRLVPLSWGITKVTDASGNEMEFDYAKTPGVAVGELDRDARVSRIRYGRNLAAGTGHSRAVHFAYDDVHDKYWTPGGYDQHSFVGRGYIAGQRSEQRHLLTTIKTQVHEGAPPSVNEDVLAADGAFVQRTVVTYEPIPAALDGHSGEARFRAKSVQLHDGKGASLPPTTLTWSKGPNQLIDDPLDGFAYDGQPFYPQPSIALQMGANPPPYMRPAAQVMGDFDADGDLDMLVSPEPVNSPGGIYHWELWRMDQLAHQAVGTNIVSLWNSHAAVSPVGKELPAEAAWNPQGPYQVPPPRQKDYALAPKMDEKAQPMTFAVNYDGAGGTDVLIGSPVGNLAGAFMDPPYGLGRYTFADRGFRYKGEDWKARRHRADYEGHPGIMNDLAVYSLVPGSEGEFEQRSLGYVSDKPILWAYPVDLDGDRLSDLMFCQANESYVGHTTLPVTYHKDEDKHYWVEGKLRYAMNVPGQGIDLSGAGSPVLGGQRCHFKDYIYIADTLGDGREQLLRVKFYGNALLSPLVDWDNPPPYDPENPSPLVKAIKAYFDAADPGTYTAYVYDSEDDDFAAVDTGLPFDTFLRWRFRGGGERPYRYSGFQQNAGGFWYSWNESFGWFEDEQPDPDWDNYSEFIEGESQNPLRFIEFPYQPTLSGGMGNALWGDFNGDGLNDMLAVEIKGCVLITGATDLDGDFGDDVFEHVNKPGCTQEDALNWGRSPYETSLEQLTIAVYWNTGKGFVHGGSVDDDLWNGEITDPECADPENSDPECDKADVMIAAREWIHEWSSAQVTDRNKDGVSDVFFFNFKAQFEQPGVYCEDLASCPDQGGDVLFRLQPMAFLGSPGGTFHVKPAYTGVLLGALAEDYHPGDAFVWGYDLLLSTDALKSKPAGYAQWLWDSLSNSENENHDFSAVTKYEAHQYGLQVRTLFTDLDSDGVEDVMVYDHLHGRWELGRGETEDEIQPMLLTGVRNGLGAQLRVEYEALRSVYTEGANDGAQVYPLSGAVMNYPVVSAVLHDTGFDDGNQPKLNRVDYRYEGARTDVRRGAALGFRVRTAHSQIADADGIVDQAIYERYDNSSPLDEDLGVYPLAGAPLSRVTVRQKLSEDRVVIAHEGFRHSGHAGPIAGTWRRDTDEILTATYELPFLSQEALYCLIESVHPASECSLGQGAAFTPVTSSRQALVHDPVSGVLTQDTVESAGTTTITRRELFDDLGLEHYAVGLVKDVIVASEPSPGAGYTWRHTRYGYDGKNRLEKVEMEPNRPRYHQWVIYTRDAWGNAEETRRYSEEDAQGSQVNKTHYGQDGVFPSSSENALGHEATTTWFAGCGMPRRASSPMNLEVEVMDIDGFCRPRGSQLLLGNELAAPKRRIDYTEWAAGEEEGYPDVEVKVTTSIDGGGSSFTATDRLGRRIRTQNQSLGTEVYTLTEYDLLGRPFRESLPAKTSGGVDEPPAGWTASSFDGANRVAKVTQADGTIVSIARGRDEDTTLTWTTITDPVGRTQRHLENALGQIVRVSPPVDPEQPQHDLCYTYGPFGVMTRVAPCADQPTTLRSPLVLTYDDYGRRETTSDGQLGTRRTVYDAFGRVRDVIDAKQQITHLEYDVLDRVISRTQAHDTPQAKTAQWIYDTPALPGYLMRTVNGDGTVTVDHQYDELGRRRGHMTTIHGRTFVESMTYDDRQRIASWTYPSPIAGDAVMLRNGFDGFDQLTSLTYVNENKLLWEPVEVDAAGRLVHQRYGNEVEAWAGYDPQSGALEWSRASLGSDPVLNPLQHLTYEWYDDGRLKARAREPLFAPEIDQVETYVYNGRGELGSWTTTVGGGFGKGVMRYDGLGGITKSPAGTYQYVNERLKKITSKGGEIKYDLYDANGNVLVREQGNEKALLTYDALDQVASLSSSSERLVLTYDADGRKVHVKDLITGLETFQLGGYEEVRGGGLGNGVVARHALGVAHLVRTWTDPVTEPVPTDVLTYVQPGDPLGSMSLITGEDGAIVEERSYGPWGTPRDAKNWLQPQDGVLDLGALNVGFGGAEGRRYPGGLTPMEARWYDRVAGRFIQADTIVPDLFTQVDGNRYAFVRNEPTSYDDPTGHSASCLPGSPKCQTMALLLYFSAGGMISYNDVLNSVNRIQMFGQLGSLHAGLSSLLSSTLGPGWRIHDGWLQTFAGASVCSGSGCQAGPVIKDWVAVTSVASIQMEARAVLRSLSDVLASLPSQSYVNVLVPNSGGQVTRIPYEQCRAMGSGCDALIEEHNDHFMLNQFAYGSSSTGGPISARARMSASAARPSRAPAAAPAAAPVAAPAGRTGGGPPAPRPKFNVMDDAVEEIGRGQQGTAYRLKNGNVLKVYNYEDAMHGNVRGLAEMRKAISESKSPRLAAVETFASGVDDHGNAYSIHPFVAGTKMEIGVRSKLVNRWLELSEAMYRQMGWQPERSRHPGKYMGGNVIRTPEGIYTIIDPL